MTPTPTEQTPLNYRPSLEPTNADLTSLGCLLAHGTTTRVTHALMGKRWSSIGQIEQAYRHWTELDTGEHFSSYLDLRNFGIGGVRTLLLAIENWRSGIYVVNPQISKAHKDMEQFMRDVLADRIPVGHLMPSSYAYAARLGLTSDAGVNIYRVLSECGFLDVKANRDVVVTKPGKPCMIGYGPDLSNADKVQTFYSALFVSHNANSDFVSGAAPLSSVGVENYRLIPGNMMVITKIDADQYRSRLNPMVFDECGERYSWALQRVVAENHVRDCACCRARARGEEPARGLSCPWPEFIQQTRDRGSRWMFADSPLQLFMDN